MSLIDTLKYKKMKHDRKRQAEKKQALFILAALCVFLLFVALIAALFNLDHRSTPESRIKPVVAQVQKTQSAPPVETVQEEQERTSKQEQFCLRLNASMAEPALTKAIEQCAIITKNWSVEKFVESMPTDPTN